VLTKVAQGCEGDREKHTARTVIERASSDAAARLAVRTNILTVREAMIGTRLGDCG
jgi:hypothetical protein